jgi:hypothetical protein
MMDRLNVVDTVKSVAVTKDLRVSQVLRPTRKAGLRNEVRVHDRRD